MNIKELFEKDIHRNINGVIKVGQQDNENAHILHQCISTKFGSRLIPKPSPEMPVALAYSLLLSVAN
jgi:hypothetical protein